MNSSILEALQAHIDTAMQKNEDTLQKAIDSVQKNKIIMQYALTEIRKFTSSAAKQKQKMK